MEMFLGGTKDLTPQDIELYYKLNEQAKDIKKKLDALKDKIKGQMIEHNIDVIDTGEYTVCITHSSKKHIDEDKLVDVLYNKKLYNTLAIVRKPIYSEIELSISNGFLTQEEYNDCIDVTIINNLNVKHH